MTRAPGLPSFTMAGLDPATQPASVRERNDFFARADARSLDGRRKCLPLGRAFRAVPGGGHGEVVR